VSHNYTKIVMPTQEMDKKICPIMCHVGQVLVFLVYMKASLSVLSCSNFIRCLRGDVSAFLYTIVEGPDTLLIFLHNKDNPY
jgi:hypothetical protein